MAVAVDDCAGMVLVEELAGVGLEAGHACLMLADCDIDRQNNGSRTMQTVGKMDSRE